MNKGKYLLSLLLSFVLISSNSSVFAKKTSVDGSKKASPTELTEDNKVTTVKLSLPSEEYQNKVDIAFVMDDSTSTKNSNLNFAEEVEKLLNNATENNPNIELKVSVVKFKGFATDMLDGLKEYNDSNKDTIIDAIKNGMPKGSGTNIHSGLVKAEKLLSADTEVKDDNKYVFLLTDGKSYIWNNENDEPTTIYAQWIRHQAVQAGGFPVINQYAGSYSKETTYGGIPYNYEKGAFFFGPTSSNSDYYQRLYNSTDSELTSPTKYDSKAYYSKYYEDSTMSQLEGSVKTYKPSNSDVLGKYKAYYQTYYEFTPTPGSLSENINYHSLNPFKLKTDEEGNVLFDTDNPDPDFYMLHADGIQKGTYTAGHFWKEKLASKYHTAAIVANPTSLSAGTLIAGSFDSWLIENSEYGAIINNSDNVKEIFDSISNEILYLVNSGEVKDIIPDDFDLVEKDDKTFTLTKDGEELAGTYDADKNTWSFEETEDGKSDYVISYDKESSTITWTINVPVETSHPVSLSYDLQLKGDKPAGTYDTNTSAVLTYKTSDGEEGSYTFEVPKVNYKEKEKEPEEEPKDPEDDPKEDPKEDPVKPDTPDDPKEDDPTEDPEDDPQEDPEENPEEEPEENPEEEPSEDTEKEEEPVVDIDEKIEEKEDIKDEEDKEKSDKVKTGDSTYISLWVSLFLLSGLLIAIMYVQKMI